MTTTQTQLRRDTATNVQAATPAAGEPGYDSTNKRFIIGDGVTAGGIPHASFADVQKQGFAYSTVGGTANAITLTNSPAVTSYSGGCLKLQFKAANTNSGTTTVNVDGLGTKNIYKLYNGSLVALSAGDIVSGAIYEIAYDGTQFQIKGLPNAAPDAYPGAVTGALSGHPFALTVDFTTYSAYSLIIVEGNSSGLASNLALEVSSNGGGLYVPIGTSGAFGQTGAAFYRSYIVTQPSASGPAYAVGEQTGGKAAMSAAVNRVRIGNDNGYVFTGGSVILQPLTKR
ncbi:hypothetical protein J8F10_08830 [Gemmata sp. G18]|uniref:Major tropism determinant N-terminal domain-containing protein n=1 Tax=Gemmata palustris TaxID=2822762 RepID=A0ABS5BNT2_9BACT|nr:hypothetical protein [Gemmata palustris]MBP3955383.1 hypothetical protein [Gemmata palustris]